MRSAVALENRRLSRRGHYVAALDLTGAPMWITSLAQDTGRLTQAHLSLASDGSIAVAGFLRGQLTIGGEVLDSHTDTFDTPAIPAFLRLDPDGTPRYGRAFDTVPTKQNVVHAVATAPNGDLVIAGYHAEPIDLGTGPLPLVGDTDGYVVRVYP